MTHKDRTAEPWGTRMAYGTGQSWPVRVDSHLAEGIAAVDVDRWVQTASILHSKADAMEIAFRTGPNAPCPSELIPLFTAGWRECPEPTTSAPPAPEQAVPDLQ